METEEYLSGSKKKTKIEIVPLGFGRNCYICKHEAFYECGSGHGLLQTCGCNEFEACQRDICQ